MNMHFIKTSTINNISITPNIVLNFNIHTPEIIDEKYEDGYVKVHRDSIGSFIDGEFVSEYYKFIDGVFYKCATLNFNHNTELSYYPLKNYNNSVEHETSLNIMITKYLKEEFFNLYFLLDVFNSHNTIV